MIKKDLSLVDDYESLTPEKIFSLLLRGHTFNFGSVDTPFKRKKLFRFLRRNQFIKVDPNHRVYYLDSDGVRRNRYKPIIDTSTVYTVMIPFIMSNLSVEEIEKNSFDRAFIHFDNIGNFLLIDLDKDTFTFWASADSVADDDVNWCD